MLFSLLHILDCFYCQVRMALSLSGVILPKLVQQRTFR